MIVLLNSVYHCVIKNFAWALIKTSFISFSFLLLLFPPLSPLFFFYPLTSVFPGILALPQWWSKYRFVKWIWTFFLLINKFWKNLAKILWICSIILQCTSQVLNIFYERFWVSSHSVYQLITTNMFRFSIHELVLIHCMFLIILLFSSANLISFTYLLIAIFYDLSISGI